MTDGWLTAVPPQSYGPNDQPPSAILIFKVGIHTQIETSTVRPDGVVDLPPAFDEHLGLEQRVKRFPFQQFVSQLSVETLDVAILPMVS